MTRNQKISLYAMTGFYILAGINHFLKPDFYLAIMPDFMPYKEFLNWVSGGFEVVLGFGLLSRVTRKFSSWLIILMLISFFSVHISHLIHPPEVAEGKYYVLILRIPIQLVLIFWAWKVGKIKNVPQTIPE